MTESTDPMNCDFIVDRIAAVKSAVRVMNCAFNSAQLFIHKHNETSTTQDGKQRHPREVLLRRRRAQGACSY